MNKSISKTTQKVAVEYLRYSKPRRYQLNCNDSNNCFVIQGQMNAQKAHDMEIEIDRSYFEAGISSYSNKRPALKGMLKYIKESKGRINFIIVYNLDRLTRDIGENEITKTLAETGVQIISSVEEFDKLPLDDFTYHVKGKAAICNYLYHSPEKKKKSQKSH